LQKSLDLAISESRGLSTSSKNTLFRDLSTGIRVHVPITGVPYSM